MPHGAGGGTERGTICPPPGLVNDQPILTLWEAYRLPFAGRRVVNSSEHREILDILAASLGFDNWGCCSAEPLARSPYYRRWLNRGWAGGMDYLHRHMDKRLDASLLLPGARSVIVCALNYRQPPPPAPADDCPRGRVAMYAWGDDYHRVLKRKLFALADGLRERIAEPFETKVCVDTAPLVEREYAMRAGIGWIGKNTLVLNAELGSYFFLGEIVTTLALAPDAPAVDHCGSCTRCLQACPTAAFPEAYQMNASRCVSYRTIECRDEALPAELSGGTGDWVFGCDVCQEVCPHNGSVPPTGEPRFAARAELVNPRLADLLTWSDEEYRTALAGSAMKRAKPDMLRRNARIAKQNLPRLDQATPDMPQRSKSKTEPRP